MQRGTTCNATRRDGSPCTSPLVGASGPCFAHDRDRQAEMREARVRGGRGKGRLARVEKLVPGTLRPVLALLLDALEQTHRGELDPKIATAVAALAGAVVRVYTSATVEQQIADLQEQIATLSRRSAS